VLAENPSSPNTIYAGGFNQGASGLWKSVDTGSTWTAMITNSALDISQISDFAVVNGGQVFYAAGKNNTGFYISLDGGTTWTTSQAATSGAVGGMAIDPQNYATIYLSVAGVGVVKSIDSGTTWTLLSSSPVITAGSATAVLHNPIEVDPTNTSTVYYGTDHGLYITTDGGSTWTSSSNGIASGDVGIRDVAVDQAAPSNIFLLAGISGSTVVDLYESTNAGSSWTPLATGLDAERVVPDPNNASVIYLYGLQFHAAYKSTDGGHSFAASDAGTPTAGSSGGSSGSLSLTGPTGTMIPLAASPGSFLMALGGAGIYKTVNAAQSWSYSGEGTSEWNGITLAVDPETPTTMYFGALNGGGIFKSTDNGVTWANLRNGDSVTDIAVDPFDSTDVLAATLEEGLIASHDGGNTWKDVSSSLPPPPTGFAIITGINFHPKQQGLIFVATVAGGIGLLRSTDGGSTYSEVNTGLTSTDVGGCIAVNPANPHTLLIADGVGIAISEDDGSTWSETKSTITCPFSVDTKSNPPTIYAVEQTSAYSASGAKSTDFGKTWTTLTVGPNLVADPSTANSVFAVSSENYVLGPNIGAWSPDAGVTWYSLLTSGLGWTLIDPGGYAWDGLAASGTGLVIAPTSPQVLFVASWSNGLLRFVVGP